VWWLRCGAGCGPHIAKTHTPRERNQKRSKRTTREARKTKRASRCAHLLGHPPVCSSAPLVRLLVRPSVRVRLRALRPPVLLAVRLPAGSPARLPAHLSTQPQSRAGYGLNEPLLRQAYLTFAQLRLASSLTDLTLAVLGLSEEVFAAGLN